MEILLAIVVASAVIFFGALISMGNERQRRSIDALREQTVLWAIQDLRIKRENFSRDLRVEDPISWLNIIATRVYGYDLKLQTVEAFDDPKALICVSGDGTRKVVFTPFSPNDIRIAKREKKNRLSHYAESNLLLVLPKGVTGHEISVLNGGILFDLELSLVWKSLTSQEVERLERIWIYSFP